MMWGLFGKSAVVMAALMLLAQLAWAEPLLKVSQQGVNVGALLLVDDMKDAVADDEDALLTFEEALALAGLEEAIDAPEFAGSAAANGGKPFFLSGEVVSSGKDASGQGFVALDAGQGNPALRAALDKSPAAGAFRKGKDVSLVCTSAAPLTCQPFKDYADGLVPRMRAVLGGLLRGEHGGLTESMAETALLFYLVGAKMPPSSRCVTTLNLDACYEETMSIVTSDTAMKSMEAQVEKLMHAVGYTNY